MFKRIVTVSVLPVSAFAFGMSKAFCTEIFDRHQLEFWQNNIQGSPKMIEHIFNKIKASKTPRHFATISQEEFQWQVDMETQLAGASVPKTAWLCCKIVKGVLVDGHSSYVLELDDEQANKYEHNKQHLRNVIDKAVIDIRESR